MYVGGGRARALSAVGCYFFVGGSSTCLVCCRLLFFCGWVEHVPCLLYWSTYARHVCGSRAFVSNHLIFFVWSNFPKFSFPRWYFENFLNHAPNFLFPVGISRIFLFSPLVFREFSQPRAEFSFVFRFVNTKVLDFRIAHTETQTHTQRGKIFIFGPMVFFRILYTFVIRTTR